MHSEEESQYRTPPSEGERRARVGYRNQDLVAASLILRALREGRLQWIGVTDPEAGSVDDIQIGTANRVDAYQVKWSEYKGSFSFRQLTEGYGNKPSLIRQLADGWMRLKGNHPQTSRIVVHLVTNNIPSTQDTPPVGDSPPRPRHFAVFLEQAWKPAKSTEPDSEWSIPEPWKPAWKALQEASGLLPDDFEAFVKDCELEFDHHLPEYDMTDIEQERAKEDLDDLARFLFEIASHPQRIFHLTYEELLTRLGWEDRFRSKFSHHFPVDEALYHPVEESEQQLERALSDLPGGYIAVLGTPGSGKSTLLTQTLRYRRDSRIIRYYVFTPQDTGSTALRGESENFLFDVVNEIGRVAFRVGKSTTRFDRVQLLSRFHRHLELLGEDYRTKDHKTVILIDGLDYISRERRPSHSLLRDLPLPDQIPEGVYLVLGSQTDQLNDLPPQVQHEISRQDRRIEIQPLTRKAVRWIIERAVIPADLSDEQKERIYRLSEGHPLALMYLLNRLEEARNTEEVDTILDVTEPYGDDIEKQYHSYWREVEFDYELVSLLSLLTRLRSVIDLFWVESWAGHEAVNRLRRSARHYFKQENHNRWYFFHDSFRLFLEEKSIELRPGVFDQSRNLALHRELAQRCTESSTGSLWAWEELYHLALAEEHEAVLERANQEWFRNQCLAFRPIGAIRKDIILAYRSAVAQQDPVAIVRLELAAQEINRRQFELDEIPFAPLLLEAGEVQKAVEHVRDGQGLRADRKEALQMSVKFKSAGLSEEAQRVFDLAEPLDLLTGVTPIEDDARDLQGSLLEAWAEAAVHFLNIDQIIERIQGVRHSGDPFGRVDADTATNSLRNRMLYHAGLALLYAERWEDLEKIAGALNGENAESLEWWFWLQVHSWRHCRVRRDVDRARSFLEKVLGTVVFSGLSIDSRVVLAEGVHSLPSAEHRTREFLEGVEQPPLQTGLISSDFGLNPFLLRLRLNRLLYVLGNQESPSDIIPDTTEPREVGIVIFERAICEVARIWADGLCGRRLDVSEVENKTIDLLRLFNRNWQATRNWSSWYAIEGAKGEFYTWLIDAIREHSLEAVLELRRLFEHEWDSAETGKYWPTHARRHVILHLGSNRRHGTSREWVIERLQGLEDEMLVDQEIYIRVKECRKQVEAWLEVNDFESALRLIAKMVQVSFGVGDRKDYQLDSLIQILSLINGEEPDEAVGRIKWFVNAILSLKGIAEEDIPRFAADELIRTTFRWSPRRAVSLFAWFFNKKIVWHEEPLGYILELALESDEPPTELVLSCITDILLPVATFQNPALIALLIEKTADLEGVDNAIEAAKRFIANVEVGALSSTRPGWKRGVARTLLKLGVDLHEAGLEAEDLRLDKYDEHSSQTFRIENGSFLNTEEVIIRASTVDELQEMLELGADESYFDWVPVVANLLGNLNREEVHLLRGLFQGKRRSAQVLSLLSERLLEIGDSDGAFELGLQALDASDRFGWARWFGGDGSRLDAFRALVFANPYMARNLVYETLERDGGCGTRSLEEVLPLLADEAPIREIWREIEEYLSALFESCSLPNDAPSFLDTPPPNDTPAYAVADLIIFHVNHSSGSLAQAAQHLCVNQLLQSNLAIQESIQEALVDGPDNVKENLLKVLDTASFINPPAVIPFRDKIADLSLSSNSIIQSMAWKIGERLVMGHQMIDEERAEGPDIELRLHDPGTLLFKPAARPPHIAPIEVRDQHVKDYEEWIKKCEEDQGLAIRNTSDGFIVLAEETALEYLEPKRPTETRRSVVCLSATPSPSLEREIGTSFHTVEDLLVEEYADLKIDVTPPHLVIRHKPYLYDSQGESWLALNPAVGREVGWTLTEDGLFKWVDSSGQLVAQSILWVDGWKDQPSYHHDEVGYGWLVVVSPEALEALKAKYGQLKRQVIIQRSYYGDGDRQSHFLGEEAV